MPAKRSPKKSRKPTARPSTVAAPPDLDTLEPAPPDLDTLGVAPVAPPVLPVVETPPPPKAGPPPGRDPRFAGRSQRAGQTRRYAFRRS
ncbi:hypothetical protein GCM10023176_49820 [Micromonospora coerulea]|uniref:Uncharacterized protein n=1 Tax=Micromonospora coerulea TaxID=47856 RepID=A0ABP8SWH0_9ACTN